MLRATAILLALATPAAAVPLADCYRDTRTHVLAPGNPQPPAPRDGSPIRPATTPEEKAAYAKWYENWRRTQPGYVEITTRVWMACPDESGRLTPPFRPGELIMLPSPPDLQPIWHVPSPFVTASLPPPADTPAPEPSTLALFATVVAFIGWRIRREIA